MDWQQKAIGDESGEFFFDFGNLENKFTRDKTEKTIHKNIASNY